MPEIDRRSTGSQLYCVCLASSLLGLQLYAPYTGTSAGSGWLCALIITAVPIVLSLLLYVYAFRKTGSENIFSLLSGILSPIGARFIMLLLGIFFLARIGLSLGVHVEQTRLYLLEKTPVPIVLGALLLTAAYSCRKGARALLRTCELLVLMLTIPLLILLAAGLYRCDYCELRILAQPDLNDLTEQIAPAALSTGGAECAVFFLGKSRANTKAVRAVIPAYLTCSALAALYYCISAGVLTVDGIYQTTCPFIEAARLINIGGIALTERFDLVFILIRLICVILQTSAALYCAGKAIGFALGVSKHGYTLMLCAVAAFFCALSQTLGAAIWWQTAAAGMFVILPVTGTIAAIGARVKKSSMTEA